VQTRADITLKPTSGITPEQAHDARARAWAYVFDCFNRSNGKEGGAPAAPDDAKVRSSNDSRAT
jgi:hypothetical protein